MKLVGSGKFEVLELHNPRSHWRKIWHTWLCL